MEWSIQLLRLFDRSELEMPTPSIRSPVNYLISLRESVLLYHKHGTVAFDLRMCTQ
ncbi:hypothetical protein MY4824_009443 [Beauveria thailandica]